MLLPPLLTQPTHLFLQDLAGAEDQGLQRLQQAEWQPASKVPPPMHEAVSPDLQQTVKLVHQDKPTLQFRSLAQPDAPVTSLLQLPDNSRPLSLPEWHPSGTHLAQLYAVVSDDSMTISACVIRLADMVMQSIQVEHVPDTDRPNSFEVPIFWAPNSVTLLMVRSTDRDQRQTCYRYDHPAVSSSQSDPKLLPARWHATSLHASQLSLTCKQPEHAPLQRSCLLVSKLSACKQKLLIHSVPIVRCCLQAKQHEECGLPASVPEHHRP